MTRTIPADSAARSSATAPSFFPSASPSVVEMTEATPMNTRLTTSGTPM